MRGFHSHRYTAHAHIFDKSTSRPLAGLYIQAYDKDIIYPKQSSYMIYDDCLGNDNTDAQGDFKIDFSNMISRSSLKDVRKFI